MKARNVGMSLVRSFSLRVMGSYKTPYSGGFIDTTIMEWGSEKPFSFIFASWTSTVVAFFLDPPGVRAGCPGWKVYVRSKVQGVHSV